MKGPASGSDPDFAALNPGYVARRLETVSVATWALVQ
jgi:hypothetical protein